ncbi:hypothetical protein V5799_013943 [Amblyomma americanum]|uniref:Secreted protein n=1 Tax=Amblyomma americanum TaxID=6943 RepID=A0AAQ4E4N3_AMBAM
MRATVVCFLLVTVFVIMSEALPPSYGASGSCSGSCWGKSIGDSCGRKCTCQQDPRDASRRDKMARRLLCTSRSSPHVPSRGPRLRTQ